jgi:hypothetical protein
VAKKHSMSIAIAAGLMLSSVSMGFSTSTIASTKLPRLLSCANTTDLKPTNFVISCADANAELTATVWSHWTATSATGTTKFGLNLCEPNCASSRISFFPKSSVTLSKPKSTRHGKLFSLLIVKYVLHGKPMSFSFSWTGDPGF